MAILIIIGVFLLIPIIIIIIGVGLLTWIAYKSDNPYTEMPYKKVKNVSYHSPPVQANLESNPAENISSNTEDNQVALQSELSPDLESPEQPTDGFVPITVGDDELIAPPMAKSNLEWEDTPADDSDIISDEGQLAMLNEMAHEAELRLERRMESY